METPFKSKVALRQVGTVGRGSWSGSEVQRLSKRALFEEPEEVNSHATHYQIERARAADCFSTTTVEPKQLQLSEPNTHHITIHRQDSSYTADSL